MPVNLSVILPAQSHKTSAFNTLPLWAHKKAALVHPLAPASPTQANKKNFIILRMHLKVIRDNFVMLQFLSAALPGAVVAFDVDVTMLFCCQLYHPGAYRVCAICRCETATATNKN